LLTGEVRDGDTVMVSIEPGADELKVTRFEDAPSPVAE
jgi:hypothetical protein